MCHCTKNGANVSLFLQQAKYIMPILFFLFCRNRFCRFRACFYVINFFHLGKLTTNRDCVRIK